MKIQAKCLQLTILCSSVLILSGCMTPGKNMIPQGGAMTMPQIYQQETGLASTGSNQSGVGNVKNVRRDLIGPLPKPDYVAYTATAKNQVDSLFKTLPNPEVPIYIYPHLVHVGGESYPKPGSTTDFFLYRSNHFAMPNEVY